MQITLFGAFSERRAGGERGVRSVVGFIDIVVYGFAISLLCSSLLVRALFSSLLYSSRSLGLFLYLLFSCLLAGLVSYFIFSSLLVCSLGLLSSLFFSSLPSSLSIHLTVRPRTATSLPIPFSICSHHISIFFSLPRLPPPSSPSPSALRQQVRGGSDVPNEGDATILRIFPFSRLSLNVQDWRKDGGALRTLRPCVIPKAALHLKEVVYK